MKNISIIQTVLIGVSIVAIMTAVVMFSMFKGESSQSNRGQVILWGTFPKNTFEPVLNLLQDQGKEIKDLIYVQKDSDTFADELLRAIAEGKGPDLVFLNEKQIIENQNRMEIIPFDSYPLRQYQDTFFDASSLLITQEGLLGIPFLVDPLIMYYNKNTLADAGFSKPPQTWTEILAIAPTLTQKDSSFNISKSAIALGSFDNIKHAKDIYWTLVLQAGNPVIKREIRNEKEFYVSVFKDNLNYTLNPAYAATNFFTQFSNPAKTIYSWNRSLQNSQNMFISGNLAFYIGRASELQTIKRLNPNLNFDITIIPQSQSSERKVTHGAMTILAIPKTSSNPQGAMQTIFDLTSKDVQKVFSEKFEVPSVRKDQLNTLDASNPYESIFNKSAIISRAVLEPDAIRTDSIIKELIDTVVSGQYEVSEALERADQKILLLLKQDE